MCKTKKTRAFKTAWFDKKVSKIGITDKELCEAIDEMNNGLWDADLGGNVYKKRLNKNMHRSIVLSKTDTYWFFTYLFAKADTDNIGKYELASFKKLASDMKRNTDETIQKQIENNDLVEICNEES